MKRVWKIIAAGLFVVFTGCAVVKTEVKGGGTEKIEAVYRCEDGKKIHATFVKNPSQVILVFGPGHVLRLKQALSASGARYSDGINEFWVKGNKATLTISGKTINCEVIEEKP